MAGRAQPRGPPCPLPPGAPEVLEPAVFPAPLFLGFAELPEQEAAAAPALPACSEAGKSHPGTQELAGVFWPHGQAVRCALGP